MSNKKGRIAGLDGVRAICVVFVFIDHFVVNGQGFGSLGVKLFFALSGYLIIGILHGLREKIERGASTAMSELRGFWVSRALRIFPIYYIALVYVLALAIKHGHGFTFEGWPYYSVFLGNVYIQHISHSWGSFTHLWSISVEQHFYMLISLAILFVETRRHTSLLWTLFFAAVISTSLDWASWDTTPKPYLADLLNFGFMACGGLLALSKAKGRIISPVLATAVFMASSLAFVALILDITSSLPNDLRVLIGWVSALGICFGVLAYVPQNAKSIAVTLLEWSPLRYLGTISYGFYIYHYFFTDFALKADRLTFLPQTSAVVILTLFQFGATCAVAALSWHFVERPILGLKGRMAAR